MMYLQVFLMMAACFLFAACTDSESYLYDTQETEIRISAMMTASFDTTTPNVKTDTIQPGDSLFFLSEVYPSKSIHYRQYFWTLDKEIFANEYSFKKTVLEPGTHQIAFVFVDFFGDTLSDSLSLTVASKPLLDKQNYIPATATQIIDPQGFFDFTWNAQDPDSLWNLYFHFTLWEDGNSKPLVDTLLDKAHYTHLAGFAPLKKYHWSVKAYNELGQESKDSLLSHFYVKGLSGENSVVVKVGTSAGFIDKPIQLLLSDSLGTKIYEDSITRWSGVAANMGPIPSGNYLLKISVKDYPDYEPQSKIISLKGNQVLDLDSITLVDNTAPTISSLTGSDTIDIADTLLFLVKDGAGTGIKVSSPYQNFWKILSGDTLKISFDASIQTWSFQILTLEACDHSENIATRHFYLRPNQKLSEVFSD